MEWEEEEEDRRGNENYEMTWEGKGRCAKEGKKGKERRERI